MQGARGDPDQLALVTLDIVLQGQRTDFRLAFEAAAVPPWFDARILAALLEVDEATAADYVTRLQALPMVESFAARGGWNVHETTRLAVRRRLARHELVRLQELSASAAACFTDDDEVSRIEQIYHRLLAEPESGAAELDTLWKKWHRSGRHEPLQALAVALDDLLRADLLSGNARARALVCVGCIRQGRLPLSDAEKMAREALELFDASGDPEGRMAARDQFGDVSESFGNLQGALPAYRECQQIASNLVRSDPARLEWQRELAAYEVDLAIAERLAARDASNALWRDDLLASRCCVDALRRRLSDD